jgi:DoxX
MPDFATLRLTWEPRIMSILRIMVGLLYIEHVLAKAVGFPLQPNRKPYELLLTLNPGIQGLLELVGGLLLALGLFTRPVAFISRATSEPDGQRLLCRNEAQARGWQLVPAGTASNDPRI